VPNYGWMWRPGNTWVAWNGLPPVVDAPRQYVPPRPPTVAGRPLVVVGRGPTASGFQPKIADGSKIVLRNDSAGAGVPRGVRNLGNLSRQVESKGMATLPTRSVPRAMTPGPAVMGRPEMGNMGRVGIGNREAMGAARGPRSESRGERNSGSSAPRMGGSERSSSGSRSISSTSHRSFPRPRSQLAPPGAGALFNDPRDEARRGAAFDVLARPHAFVSASCRDFVGNNFGLPPAQQQDYQHWQIHKQNGPTANLLWIARAMIPAQNSYDPAETNRINQLAARFRDQPERECIVEPALRHHRRQDQELRIPLAVGEKP